MPVTTAADLRALSATARALIADGKGLLAIDESIPTLSLRLHDAGIAEQAGMRHAFRALLATAPGLAMFISGVILHDETFGQELPDGRRLVDGLRSVGIHVGVKVDAGAHELALHPGERVTEGLDGLRQRLIDYAKRGACFAKWRAVIEPVPRTGQAPSDACLDANAQALARYAALCQEVGLVPIVEPELLAQGAHDLATCARLTERLLRAVFAQLARQDVMTEAILLKPNMVVPGARCTDTVSLEDVALATLACLRRTVPAAVPGIVFLSGGQSPSLATARLNAIVREAHGRAPWAVSFSFARALQAPVLAAWQGLPDRDVAARAALLHRLNLNRAALRGTYDPATDPA